MLDAENVWAGGTYALSSTTRGRPRESNPRRAAAPKRYRRAPPAPAPAPAPQASDGSVASDPLIEEVKQRSVTILARTDGQDGSTSGHGLGSGL